MIGPDVLIKYVRSHEEYRKGDWPSEVIRLLKRLSEIKLGFPGIKSSHLSLVRREDIKDDDIFIVDTEFYTGKIDAFFCPKMYTKLPNSPHYQVSGIGCGLDLGDIRRQKIRYKDIVSSDQIPNIPVVLRVDVRPTLDGGPGYYYFFRSYRDFRM